MTRAVIAEHYESIIGKASAGWAENVERNGAQNLVFAFNNCQYSGLNLFATAGMSSHIMTDRLGQFVRQELTIVADASFDSDTIVDDLFKFMRIILEEHTAIERGDLITSKGCLASNYGKDILYCTFQSYFDDNLAACRSTDPVTEIIWLIPVNATEADFIKSCGWRAFEKMLEARDINVANFRRTTAITD